MLPLGTALPAIRLVNAVDQTSVDVEALAAGKRGVLVMFLCNHCPYVVHLRRVLARVANDAVDRGFVVVGINSNDLQTYPQDGPAQMKKLALEDGWKFPFLFDESQQVAKSFGAACTPDLYLFDAAKKLAYRGQFDDSRPANGKPVTGADLSAAIDALASGRTPSADQKPSIGCGIKWRPSA
jgi:thiol-disulfide isomerase/thioredoxin